MRRPSRSRSTAPWNEGIGVAVLAAVEATRQVVDTNTNLGMILLLAPLAAVPPETDLAEGVRTSPGRDDR